MTKEDSQKKGRIPLNVIAPNLVTLFALACGVTSIRFAMEGRFEFAVIAILAAAVFDTLDGRVARMLRGTSDFGAELDSLSDVVCFGVAPGLLMYFWALGDVSLVPAAADIALAETSSVGWIFALLVPICCALRLARFNIMLDDEPQPSYWRHFFTGLPAPGGAFVALIPIMLYLHFGNPIFREGTFVEVFLFLSAFLMASRLPTISLKNFRIPVRFVVLVLGFAGFYAGALFYKPWLVLSTTFCLYVLSVPLCSFLFLRLKAKALDVGEKTAENKK